MIEDGIEIPDPLTPLWTHEFADIGWSSSCALLPWRDMLVLSHLVGRQAYVRLVHDGLRCGAATEIVVDHPKAPDGLADPKLFVHADKLFLSVVGLDGDREHHLIVSLDDELRVTGTVEPNYARRLKKERGWLPFGFGEGLYAIRSMDPWRVLHILGAEAQPVGEDSEGVKSGFGKPVAGSIPCRVGSEYYCFFGGVADSVGVATFEARWPFLLARQTAAPLFWPHFTEIPDGPASITKIPCSAYLEADQWIVSHGNAVSAFRSSDIESRLVPAGQPVVRPKAARSPSPVRPGDIMVEHGAGGIGDGLMGLLCVTKLKADNPGKTVTYHVSDNARPFVSLFGGCDGIGSNVKSHSEDTVPGRVQLNAGYHDETRAKLATPRWERYAKNIGVSGLMRPPLKNAEMIRSSGLDLAGSVVISPFSNDRTREWGLQHWLTLEKMLHKAGYPVVLIHSTTTGTELFAHARKLIKATPSRVAGVMMNAAAVIGGDSGMSHLGGILGASTIVLGGNTTVSQIFGCYPSVTCLQGDMVCSGCFHQPPYFLGRCGEGCGNIQSIHPSRVMEAVDHLAISKITEGRTLVDVPRLRVIRDAVVATRHLKGDMAELGVYLGGVSKLIGSLSDAPLHLFDTFTGIPEDDVMPDGHKAGDFPSDAEAVRLFLDNPNAKFHVGMFPKTAPDDLTRFRFVHADADTYQSTRAAIDYFSPRMVSGGIMVFDDFNWYKTAGVRKALLESFDEARIIRGNGHQAVVRF